MNRNIVSYIISTVVVLSLSALSYGQDLVILHTNDTHSQIEPKRVGPGAGFAGVSRRAAYFAKVKKENKNVLILDAGDYNQGTPYFTVFRGKMEIELMNALGYDVATIGNHEFDNGQEELAQRLSKAKFPTVCANYDFSKSPLKDYVKPYVIIKKAGKRIGIVGICIDLTNLVAVKGREGLVYQDGFEVANRIAKKLKEEDKCDLVIALTHIGYTSRSDELSDTALAERSRNIDIIIGGHSHTFLTSEQVRKNLDGKNVIIVQDGCAGEYVGRFDISF